MSIRIGAGGNEYRSDAIKRAAEFYECNKTDAVVAACEDVHRLVAAAREVLQRNDLTERQKWEIAEIFNARGVWFDVETDVTI